MGRGCGGRRAGHDSLAGRPIWKAWTRSTRSGPVEAHRALTQHDRSCSALGFDQSAPGCCFDHGFWILRWKGGGGVNQRSRPPHHFRVLASRLPCPGLGPSPGLPDRLMVAATAMKIQGRRMRSHTPTPADKCRRRLWPAKRPGERSGTNPISAEAQQQRRRTHVGGWGSGRRWDGVREDASEWPHGRKAWAVDPGRALRVSKCRRRAMVAPSLSPTCPRNKLHIPKGRRSAHHHWPCPCFHPHRSPRSLPSERELCA